MPLIDKDLKRTHVKQERLLNFTNFVKAQKEKNSRGEARACLLSEGYHDYYGKVVFATGMHHSLWILPAADNPKVLLFDDHSEAKEYAKSLQKILRDNGYPTSWAKAEQVAVRTTTEHPYTKLALPTVTYEEERYIIQMCVK